MHLAHSTFRRPPPAGHASWQAEWAAKPGLLAAIQRGTRRAQRQAPLRRLDCVASRSNDWEGYDEVVTLFTPDSIVQIPGRAGFQATDWQAAGVGMQLPLPSWDEQGLCVGASFAVSATNGWEPRRRLTLAGFCRCAGGLAEVVAAAVRSARGQVMAHDVRLTGGMHETLVMTVSLPLLWGIPPSHELLSSAIVGGGGFVEKVSREWHFHK